MKTSSLSTSDQWFMLNPSLRLNSHFNVQNGEMCVERTHWAGIDCLDSPWELCTASVSSYKFCRQRRSGCGQDEWCLGLPGILEHWIPSESRDLKTKTDVFSPYAIHVENLFGSLFWSKSSATHIDEFRRGSWCQSMLFIRESALECNTHRKHIAVSQNSA